MTCIFNEMKLQSKACILILHPSMRFCSTKNQVISAFAPGFRQHSACRPCRDNVVTIGCSGRSELVGRDGFVGTSCWFVSLLFNLLGAWGRSRVVAGRFLLFGDGLIASKQVERFSHGTLFVFKCLVRRCR